MNKIDLKQCPFCGGKAESLTPWAGGVYGTREQAEKVWNRRSGEQNE